LRGYSDGRRLVERGLKVLEVLVSFAYYMVNGRVELSPARHLIPQQPPPNPKTLFEEAQRALIAHDYAKVERGFRGVLKIDPRSVAAYSKLGVVNMRLGRYDLAIKAFTEAEKLAPEVTGLDLNPGDCSAGSEEIRRHCLRKVACSRSSRRKTVRGHERFAVLAVGKAPYLHS
jgi:tetratricopeptide (TPR) repeat protein